MLCSPVILMQDNAYRDVNLKKFKSVYLEKSSVFHEGTLLELAKQIVNRFHDTWEGQWFNGVSGLFGLKGSGLSPDQSDFVVLFCKTWGRAYLFTQEYKFIPVNCWGNLREC